MEAKEFRIGNLTQDKVTKVVYTITANALLYLVACKEEDKEAPIEPIPLTEEWLLNFGLKKMTDSSTYEWKDGDYRSVQVDLKANEAEVYLCGSDSVMSSQCFPVDHIKCVHQLQNLFFALKGKELYLTPINK